MQRDNETKQFYKYVIRNPLYKKRQRETLMKESPDDPAGAGRTPGLLSGRRRQNARSAVRMTQAERQAHYTRMTQTNR